MKRILAIVLAVMIWAGCSSQPPVQTSSSQVQISTAISKDKACQIATAYVAAHWNKLTDKPPNRPYPTGECSHFEPGEQETYICVHMNPGNNPMLDQKRGVHITLHHYPEEGWEAVEDHGIFLVKPECK
jgi:hypothetical protein